MMGRAHRTMWMRFIGGILMVLQQTNGETEHHLRSIFLPNGVGDYCHLMCPGKPAHTLCERHAGDGAYSPKNCANFQELLGSPALWTNILNAHNGVRNRFAVRFRVADMKKLTWDDELSRMARLHLNTCQRYGQDPCAGLSNTDLYHRDHRNVRQNVAFVLERYLPQYYAIDVIRLWYMQKAETPPPRVDTEGGTFANVHRLPNVYQSVLNNYSLLVWAGLERVGCAAAKYRDGFQLVCNYFPFYSLAEPSAVRGPPAGHCPRTFPLRSKIFDGLCTFEMDMGSTGTSVDVLTVRGLLLSAGVLAFITKVHLKSFR